MNHRNFWYIAGNGFLLSVQLTELKKIYDNKEFRIIWHSGKFCSEKLLKKLQIKALSIEKLCNIYLKR